MNKVIYTKYSNDRSEKFRIRTDILKKENGVICVQKYGLTKQSETHISHIAESYDALCRKYGGATIFEMNRCVQLDERTLEFEYLQGMELEKQLDFYLYHDDIQGFLELINEYKQQMEKVAIDTFSMTDEFREVFGDVKIDSNQKTLELANIDQIFQNIIINGKEWQVYDYEWTFNFPVPLKYIYYRCALFYGEFERKVYLQNRVNLMKYFGITEREKRIYEQMELTFQAYSQEGNVPLWDVYSLIAPRNYFPPVLLEEERKKCAASCIIVRRAYEDGRNDEITYNLAVDSKNRYVFEVPLPKGLKILNIVPAQGPCMVVIHMLNVRGSGAEEKEYITNGIDMENGLICYPAGDAGIWMDNFSACYHTLHVEMTVSLLENAILTACGNYAIDKSKQLARLEQENTELRQEKERLTNHNHFMEQENSRLNNEAVQYQNSYECIQNSFCWRITKPVRKILDAVKGR